MNTADYDWIPGHRDATPEMRSLYSKLCDCIRSCNKHESLRDYEYSYHRLDSGERFHREAMFDIDRFWRLARQLDTLIAEMLEERRDAEDVRLAG